MADKWDKRFMSMASLVAAWSKDPSTGCGSVIVDSRQRIVATGSKDNDCNLLYNNGNAPGLRP